MASFDPNKRDVFPVVRSQWPGFAPYRTQERNESIWAVIAVGSILLASFAFIVLYFLGD